MEFLAKRGNRGLIFQTNEPHFFKIVLEGTLHDGKLGVPKKFVKKYGHNLSNPSLLTVPNGEIWQVELAKSDGEMWYFQAGWKEFAEFYSLANGHFLVFQHKGGSHFHVLIFDTSATEIDYPINIMNGDKGPKRGGRFQETRMEETEISDDFSPSRITKEKFIATSSLPDKRLRIDSIASKFESRSKLQGPSLASPNGNQSGVIKLENPTTDVESLAQQSKANAGERRMPARKNRQRKITPRAYSLTRDEKINAYSRARVTFKSNNPFFMIAMQPSYVCPALNRARIPSEFARKYFKQSGNAVLYGLDGRSWSVGHNKEKFSKGWKKFGQDNHLEVGDVCIFELIKGTESSFNVVICRAVQDGN